MLNGQSSNVSRIVLDMIRVLVAVMEEKDSSFKGHSERVASYSIQVAHKMGLDRKMVEGLYPAALLHDIGLVFIDQELIARSGSLTESELILYEKHP
jgi:HD-GYP domain-containing protein (c-di-GMP phosphodiesterase class II)